MGQIRDGSEQTERGALGKGLSEEIVLYDGKLRTVYSSPFSSRAISISFSLVKVSSRPKRPGESAEAAANTMGAGAGAAGAAAGCSENQQKTTSK